MQIRIKSFKEAKSVKKEETKRARIAHHKEFDNGHVFHSYETMDLDAAEQLAKDASLKDPNDIYYVSFDDIMDPRSPYSWINGVQYDATKVGLRNGGVPTVLSESVQMTHNGLEMKSLGPTVEVYARQSYNSDAIECKLSCWSGDAEYTKSATEEYLNADRGAQYDMDEAEKSKIYNELKSILEDCDSKVEALMNRLGYSKK